MIDWTTTDGRSLRDAIVEALRRGTDTRELRGLSDASEDDPGCDLRGIDLSDVLAVRRSDLRGIRLDGARLPSGFGGSDLRDAQLVGATGRNVDFGGCRLERATFVGAHLPGAVFQQADLTGADATGAVLCSGQLVDAHADGARFALADLRDAWAARASLRGACLDGADLRGASLGGVRWDRQTSLERARLTREGTPWLLRAWGRLQGATVGSEEPGWTRRWIQATARLAEDDAVAAHLEAIADRAPLPRDWLGDATRAFPDQADALRRAARKAAANIGALLGGDGEAGEAGDRATD